MNIQEASIALHAGECEGIKRVCQTRVITLKSSAPIMTIDDNMADDWQLVNPIPQTEEVEVKRWAIIAPSGYCEETYSSKEMAEDFLSRSGWNGYSIIKLTGHYSRPKPRKVKKRTEIEPLGSPVVYSGEVPNNARFYAEWEEEEMT